MSVITSLMMKMMMNLSSRFTTVPSDPSESTEPRTKWLQQPDTRFYFIDGHHHHN